MPNLYIINARSLAKINAIDHLLIDIKQFNIEVAVVTETWLTTIHTNEQFFLENYTVLRNERTSKRGGGVALFIKSSLHLSVFSN